MITFDKHDIKVLLAGLLDIPINNVLEPVPVLLHRNDLKDMQAAAAGVEDNTYYFGDLHIESYDASEGGFYFKLSESGIQTAYMNAGDSPAMIPVGNVVYNLVFGYIEIYESINCHFSGWKIKVLS